MKKNMLALITMSNFWSDRLAPLCDQLAWVSWLREHRLPLQVAGDGAHCRGQAAVTAWSIRPGCLQDVDAVLALWLGAGSPPSATDTREGLACLLATDDQALLLAEVDGQLVGSLIAA